MTDRAPRPLRVMVSASKAQQQPINACTLRQAEPSLALELEELHVPHRTLSAIELYRLEKDRRRDPLAFLRAHAVSLELDRLERLSRYGRLPFTTRQRHARRLSRLRAVFGCHS